MKAFSAMDLDLVDVHIAPFAALSAPLKVPVHKGTGGFTESPQPQGATVVGHAGHEGRSNWSLRRNHAMGSQDHARGSAAGRDVARELYAARVTTGVVRQAVWSQSTSAPAADDNQTFASEPMKSGP